MLVLDEPTDGLDPNQKHEVRALIRRAWRRHKAIVISTHILEEVDAVCTRAIIIAAGRVVADETPAELQQRHPSGRLEDVFRQLTMETRREHRHTRGGTGTTRPARPRHGGRRPAIHALSWRPRES